MEESIKKDIYIFGYDIETMPNLVRTWRKWEQNVIWYERYGYVFSISCAKYKDGKPIKIIHKNITDFPLYKKDKYSDEALVKWIWEEFNKAPIVLAHNGNAFDSKTLVGRFVHYGLIPPAPYKQIDTKLLYKKYLNEDSNSLDDIIKKHWEQIKKLAKKHKIKLADRAGKINTGGYQLWQDSENCDMKAINKMRIYNNYDITCLILAYLLIRPYAESHPNIALMLGKKNVCPTCSSVHIIKNGLDYTSSTVFQRYLCKNCGARPKSKLSNNSQIR